MSAADALEREEAWYLAAVPGLPPLLAPDGPFDVVAAEVRRLSQHAHQLYLTLLRSETVRASKHDKRLDHEILAVMLWPAIGAGARAHVDQAAATGALAAVSARVAGSDAAPNHGGRWWSVGDPVAELPQPEQALAFIDAVGAGRPAHVRAVRYTVSEWA